MDVMDPVYKKYTAFNEIMLEEYDPLEVAAIMIVQGLGIYRTMLDEDDYDKMVDNISNLRKIVKKL
jgi:hypothetical protein